ncbi:DUF6290 family protein [Macrococcus capreoli]|uniref:DUF6290 family protein n=1 Tax=Macrococcus capreoli TaxID=2982690 RepID=UPI003EE73EDF
MGQFRLNLSDLDEKIIRNYAMNKGQDPSQLIRNIVISTIEDEIDLNILRNSLFNIANHLTLLHSMK